MGHLVNPLGFRVGINNLYWSSNFSFFYNKKNHKKINYIEFYINWFFYKFVNVLGMRFKLEDKDYLQKRSQFFGQNNETCIIDIKTCYFIYFLFMNPFIRKKKLKKKSFKKYKIKKAKRFLLKKRGKNFLLRKIKEKKLKKKSDENHITKVAGLADTAILNQKKKMENEDDLKKIDGSLEQAEKDKTGLKKKEEKIGFIELKSY